MKAVFAIDSFKGSLTSMEAGEAAAEGFLRAFPGGEALVRPLADGGEGTVDSLVAGLGGECVRAEVTGPLGDRVSAKYGLLPDGVTAVMEMAEASGITLVPRERLDVWRATTRGTGEMVMDAVRRGRRRFLMGIGGSATNDGGAGFLQGLGFRLADTAGEPIAPGPAGLATLARVEVPDELAALLPELSFRIACDVTNPLCGPKGASAVFGPQKGAGADDVPRLDAVLARFAETAGKRAFAEAPGAGAAGGLGFALKAFVGAELAPGADLVLAETGLEDALSDADVVVTGEGRLDEQTVMGKAPAAVAQLAKRHGKPVVAFAGCVTDGATACNGAGIDAFFPILRGICTLDEALAKPRAAANLAAAAEQAFRLLRVRC